MELVYKYTSRLGFSNKENKFCKNEKGFFPQRIIFAPPPTPKYLNDPEECKEKILNFNNQDFYNKEILNIPENYKIDPKKYGVLLDENFVNRINLKLGANLKKEEIIEILKKCPNECSKSIVNSFKSDCKSGLIDGCCIYKKARENFLNRFGIISFTKRNNMKNMWAYYANNYNGIAIGINKLSSVFHLDSTTDKSLFGFHDVLYADEKDMPTIDYSQIDEYKIDKNCFKIKNLLWHSEEEIRFIIPIKKEEERNIHIPSNDIVEIVMGFNIPKIVQKQIVEYCNQYLSKTILKIVEFDGFSHNMKISEL